MPEKVGIITQVRMTSTRLPGKVLKQINNKSLLEYHIERLQAANLPLVVATTTNTQDDPIDFFCRQKNISCFRGSEHHVLSRFYNAAIENNFDVIVRVTSDCPFIDGEIIKTSVAEHLAENNLKLYTSNVLERTFPRGLDFEIFSFESLERAFKNAASDAEIEHVTPYINRNIDGLTVFKHIKSSLNKSDWRLTVDTPEDFELIKILIEKFNMHQLNYTQMASVLENNNHLKSLNQHIEQKKI